MLLKLIKHEFRCTGRIMLPILAAVLALSVMAGVSMKVVSSYDGIYWVLKAVLYLIEFAFFASLFAACIVAFVLMIQRFYRSLMGDEGYISFTLPVSADSHIWNKLITSAVWFLAVGLVCVLANIITFAIAGHISGNLPDLGELFSALADELGGGKLAIFCLECLIIAALGCFDSCLHFYCAMAVGCSSSSSKKLLSVVAYFVISFARNVLSLAMIPVLANKAVFGWLNLRFSFDTLMDTAEFVLVSGGTVCLALIVLDGIYYVITRSFMTRKLNLA